jgi:hypothetical protein
MRSWVPLEATQTGSAIARNASTTPGIGWSQSSNDG